MERDSRVERLMQNGFDRRVKQFRQTGQALELKDIPEVLDSLLDLNSTELEQVIEELGLHATELRHDDGTALSRITPDYVIQLLGGNRHGAFNLLPTTEKQAAHALEEVSRRIRSLTRSLGKLENRSGHEAERSRLSAELARLGDRRSELVTLRDGLAAVPRVHGWKEMGLVSCLMLSAGKSNALDTRTTAERLAGNSSEAPAYGRLLGHGSSVGLGMGVSRVDRHSGKRDFVPYAQLSTDMVAGGINYTVKKDERSLDTSIHPFFFTIGNDPVCGRHIYFAPPLGVSFTIGERFLGIGIPQNLFNKKKSLFESKFLDVDPILLLGIRGDPIQEFTGPVIRWSFKAYDAIKRRLGIPEKRRLLPEADPTQPNPHSGEADWLKPDETMSSPFPRELFND